MTKSINAERIFFYCIPTVSAENAAYQHLVVCLGEGLQELNVEFYSNIHYWPLSVQEQTYLFQPSPDVTPDDCTVVVVDQSWFLAGKPFPQSLFHPCRNYITVYLDCTDGSSTFAWNPEFRQFDVILRTHFSNKIRQPANFQPWAFGISQRIMQATKPIPKFSEKQPCLLVNFRNGQNIHSVRKAVYREILPQIQSVLQIDAAIENSDVPPLGTEDYLLWFQTGRRHYPSYYKRLKESLACACFGGFFESPWGQDKTNRISRLQKRILTHMGWKTQIISQWDSWRLWESFAAGCATFHVDFEKYGFVLPIMPENWRHYIGIDFDNIQATVERIYDDPGSLQRVAEAGRVWALEHYAPVPTAIRFLEAISKEPYQTSENILPCQTI